MLLVLNTTMNELVGLDFDDTDAGDDIITSLYHIGDAVLSIRQNPGGGRHAADGYDQLSPEQSAATTLDSATQACDGYRSNTPNVGWLVWSSTFVLARHLLNSRASWEGVRVLELVRCCSQNVVAPSCQNHHLLFINSTTHQGAGVGLLGLALAKHGARVTLTDLPHVTPLTRQNVERNFATDTSDNSFNNTSTCPRVVDYMWGNTEQLAAVLDANATTRSSVVGTTAATSPELYPIVLAADCVYEQQYYPDLLCALRHTVVPVTGRAYVCYKRRRLRQELFATAARDAGWVVEEVEVEDEDYCCLELCLMGESNF